MSMEATFTDESLQHGLACFYLDEDLFSVNIRLVREINAHLDISPARRAPSYVTGLVNLRGQIVTVIDLGDRLGIGSRPITDKSRLMILKTNAELEALDDCELATCDDKVGLLVDRISDVVTPTVQQLEPPPPNISGEGAEFLAGVCKTEEVSMGIIDLHRLLRISSEAVEA